MPIMVRKDIHYKLQIKNLVESLELNGYTVSIKPKTSIVVGYSLIELRIQW